MQHCPLPWAGPSPEALPCDPCGGHEPWDLGQTGPHLGREHKGQGRASGSGWPVTEQPGGRRVGEARPPLQCGLCRKARRGRGGGVRRGTLETEALGEP